MLGKILYMLLSTKEYKTSGTQQNLVSERDLTMWKSLEGVTSEMSYTKSHALRLTQK